LTGSFRLCDRLESADIDLPRHPCSSIHKMSAVDEAAATRYAGKGVATHAGEPRLDHPDTESL
jgi:hypothetical protein